MKKFLYTFLLISWLSPLIYSQIAINQDGSAPHNSAILDLKSSSKGLLIPSMSTADIQAIPNPAEGLMVFDNQQIKHVLFNGLNWINQNEKHLCGIPFIDERDAKTYNTIKIGDQCWLKENLNIGTMIDENTAQSDNDVIEKYCYDDNSTYCDTFGGLYYWQEMMEYETGPGNRGICPVGWHIPSDQEWKILEGNVDSQYGVGDPEWDNTSYRGFDAGLKLKSQTYWLDGEDEFHFSVLPAGLHKSTGFNRLYERALFWTSSGSGDINWQREFKGPADGISRDTDGNIYGYSVRCLRD